MVQTIWIVAPDDLFLVTGANRFIGVKVVHTLLDYGFRKIRCFVRPSSDLRRLRNVFSPWKDREVEIFEGNLLAQQDCEKAGKNVSIIYHFAAEKGKKS